MVIGAIVCGVAFAQGTANVALGRFLTIGIKGGHQALERGHGLGSGELAQPLLGLFEGQGHIGGGLGLLLLFEQAVKLTHQ